MYQTIYVHYIPWYITDESEGNGWLLGYVHVMYIRYNTTVRNQRVVWCNVVGVIFFFIFPFSEIRVGLFGFGFVVPKMK